MGSAASTLPATLDKETAKNTAGEKWDEAAFDKYAVDGVISREDFVREASSIGSALRAWTEPKLQKGDIVKARETSAQKLWFEGVVTEIGDEDTFMIDFGEEDSAPVKITRENIHKTKDWSSLEIADVVKVRMEGGNLEFQGVVQSVEIDASKDTPITYTVMYEKDEYNEEEELESDITLERITKISTGRLSAEARWTQLRNVVKLIGLAKPKS